MEINIGLVMGSSLIRVPFHVSFGGGQGIYFHDPPRGAGQELEELNIAAAIVLCSSLSLKIPRGYIGIMENQMEATGIIQGL